jgi:hypothetical protein
MRITSPQLKMVLIGEDYGLKVSIRENKGRANSEPAFAQNLLSDVTQSLFAWIFAKPWSIK